ncbi:MAG: hypothetical protein RIS39_1174 [Actinomycetota bacterium]|jgi:hypothetical protein
MNNPIRADFILYKHELDEGRRYLDLTDELDTDETITSATVESISPSGLTIENVEPNSAILELRKYPDIAIGKAIEFDWAGGEVTSTGKDNSYYVTFEIVTEVDGDPAQTLGRVLKVVLTSGLIG